MSENNDSVYSLVTKLCEKLSSDPSKTKKLRSLSYEILLKKKQPLFKKVFDFDAPSPMIDLLAWIFQLNSHFNLIDYGKQLKQAAEDLEAIYEGNLYEFNQILRFLLDLRTVPTIKCNPLESEFDIPQNLCKLFNKKPSNESKEIIFEKYNEENDIWYIAYKSKFSKRKNWENFGLSEPKVELPFLMELKENSHLLIENLSSVYFQCAYNKSIVYKPKIRDVEGFVNDLKYLMVGLSSFSFNYNENDNFYLIPTIMVDGLAPNVLKIFTEDLIQCGNCYKDLKDMCMSISKGELEENGYIFKEFWKSIENYLTHYRTAIFNIKSSTGPLCFSNITKKIRQQIFVLTSICKLGPYKEKDKTIPKGVTLLNYLYHKISSHMDRDVLLVLYSVFYPCCQVYFNRFLQQWILDGTINDPYNEFFIKENSKYISTRGRTYWTRSLSVSADKIPDFIPNISEVLNCGKSINLLKLCNNSNKISMYLRDVKPPIFSCCVTFDKINLLEHNCTKYFLEISSELGVAFSLETLIKQSKESDPSFSEKILLKRAQTLKRIEDERRKKLEEEREKKIEQMSLLKEQYDLAIQQKQSKIINEIEKEMKNIEDSLINNQLKKQKINKESQEMIKYYEEMNKISTERKQKIEKNIEIYKKVILDHENPISSPPKVEEKKTVTNAKIEEKAVEKQKELDVINANTNEPSDTIKEAIKNFEQARLNKQKVMNEELGIILNQYKRNPTIITQLPPTNLTEAQRNKLRMLTTEFHINPMIFNRNLIENKIINDNLDNINDLNENPNDLVKKTDSLVLPIRNFYENDSNKATPMSVDSTPISDLGCITPSSKITIESNTTAPQTITDEGFSIIEDDYNIKNYEFIQIFSKKIEKNQLDLRSINCFKILLEKSLIIPLNIENNLLNNELLRYFIINLNYLKHLNNLRNYFLMQDGEFTRRINDILFEKFFNSKLTSELINFKFLQNLIWEGLENSNKYKFNSNYLSFKINSIPKRFNLSNPDVLDCLSLTYKINWPLNILLPTDTIVKYDQVFKFLLKLNLINWILKQIFLELKMLAKETGQKEIYLMMSPQYRKVHQSRHIMLHFIQTLQNYFVGEVLQSCWERFEEVLMNVKNIDELYTAHVKYIKNILFLCLLNQKSSPLKKIIQDIYVVILKFYNYLRSRKWYNENGYYIHPNFKKLENIFENFEEFVLYFLKVGSKVVKSGYQPQISHLLYMLDITGYYSKKK